jgi:hypothetical protein
MSTIIDLGLELPFHPSTLKYIAEVSASPMRTVTLTAIVRRWEPDNTVLMEEVDESAGRLLIARRVRAASS